MHWKKIKSAPRDRHLLLFGTMRKHLMVGFSGPVIFSGYWDEIDGCWCCTGSTENGPFFDPTHWMPLPDAPLTREKLKTAV